MTDPLIIKIKDFIRTKYVCDSSLRCLEGAYLLNNLLDCQIHAGFSFYHNLFLGKHAWGFNQESEEIIDTSKNRCLIIPDSSLKKRLYIRSQDIETDAKAFISRHKKRFNNLVYEFKEKFLNRLPIKKEYSLSML